MEHTARQFPGKCWSCDEREVRPTTIPWDSKVRVGDRLYRVQLPAIDAYKCGACGKVAMPVDADEPIRHEAKRMADSGAPSEPYVYTPCTDPNCGCHDYAKEPNCPEIPPPLSPAEAMGYPSLQGQIPPPPQRRVELRSTDQQKGAGQ